MHYAGKDLLVTSKISNYGNITIQLSRNLTVSINIELKI